MTTHRYRGDTVRGDRCPARTPHSAGGSGVSGLGQRGEHSPPERFLVSSQLRPSRRLGGRDGNCDDVPLCVLSREMRVDVLTLALITAHIGHMPSIRLLAFGFAAEPARIEFELFCRFFRGATPHWHSGSGRHQSYSAVGASTLPLEPIGEPIVILNPFL